MPSNNLEHYGVKGMKKPTPPSKLDRVYRVAAGTAALKDKIQTARKTTVKDASDAAKKLVKDQAQANLAAQKAAVNPDNKSELDLGESTLETLLQKCGAMKLADLE